MKPSSFAAVLGAITLGCITSSTPSPKTGALRDVMTTEDGNITRTTPDYAIQGTIKLPVDEAFASMLIAYSRLGIETTTNDSGSHTLGNTSFVLRRRFRNESLSRYFECGRDGFGIPRADSYTLVVSTITSLTPGGPSLTKVETLVTAKGSDPSGNASDVYCSTTGHLEAELIRASEN